MWQENPDKRVQHSKGKWDLRSFPLERWTQGVAFSCHYWKLVINSFSHMPSRKQRPLLLFLTQKYWNKMAKTKNFNKTNQFCYQNVSFISAKTMLTHTSCFCSQIKQLQVFENSNRHFTSGGGRVVRRCCVSYITGASNWYWLTVGQGLLSL